MPLGSASKTTIDIDYTRAQGVNSTGRITFTPPRQKLGTTMLSIFGVSAKVIEGVGSISLARLPSGTYRVREEIDGKIPYEYNFALPLSAPDTIQYEDIAEVSPVPETFVYVKTVNGEAPDPTTGNVEIEAGGAADATTTTKGIVRLAGDLAGTATTPTLSSARSAEIAGKYVKPGLGIPSSDFTTAVQALLSLASTSVQPSALDAISDELDTKYVKPGPGIPTTDLVASAQNGISLGATAVQPAELDAVIAGLNIPDSPGDIGAQPAGDYTLTSTTNALDDRVDALEAMARVTPFIAIEYGIYSATGPDPLMFMQSAAWNNDIHQIFLQWIPANVSLTKVFVGVRIVGTYSATGTPAQVKVYDTSGALLGSSPDDPTMWLTKGLKPQTLSVPLAPQSTGRFVYVGISGGGFSGHSAAWPTGISSEWVEGVSTGLLVGRRRSFYSSSSAGLPNSFNPATYGTHSTWIPFVGLA